IDLADMGFKVYLVEKEPFLGGISAKAGRFFPTDDCAMCVQSPSCDLKGVTNTSRKCLYRSGFSEIPNLTIYTNAKVVEVEGDPGSYTITVEKKPRYVDETRCMLCGLCAEACPVETSDLFNAGLTTRKAIYTNFTNVYPPAYVIDESLCKFHDCAKCVDVCPTKAIDLDKKSEKVTFNVGTIIVATGFEEFDPSVIKEYKYGVYPDVVTQLELARMTDPFGPTSGKVIRPSNRERAKTIVMIQCVGSRDKRYNLYCSSICCMIALKHALMIKEVDPEAEIYICYIDIRTTGRGHEDYYERAREAGIKFVKGRPTEIIRDPESGKLVVDVEDALSGDFLGIEADLVVLSTAFVPSKTAKELAEIIGLEMDEDGFFKEYNSKLRPTETKLRGVYICGGAAFPKDAPTTSLHAHSASIKAAKFMSTGKIVKDLRVAVIDTQYCGDCEFCPVVCPYGAITHVEEEEGHGVESISELKCEGCGLCVGTCPLNAIELRHYTEAQLLAQIRALSSKIDSSDPVVLAICCAECGHTAVDSSGMAMMEYPPNVRVMRVPCTGILKVHHYFEAFKSGADAVMVVGCKPEGCHYEEGSVKAKQKVTLAKRLLEGYGIAPERLEMFNMVMIEGNLFVEAAKMMTERVEKLGSLKNILTI
ncbi:MAG: disulfide reductase, partial [Thermotogae bacterium]